MGFGHFLVVNMKVAKTHVLGRRALANLLALRPPFGRRRVLFQRPEVFLGGLVLYFGVPSRVMVLSFAFFGVAFCAMGLS